MQQAAREPWVAFERRLERAQVPAPQRLERPRQQTRDLNTAKFPGWGWRFRPGPAGAVKGLGPRSSDKQPNSTIEDGFQKIGPAMPTVLRINGYQFYFYAEEGNEPPHIHVAKGGFDAKFWLSPAHLAVNHGFRPHDLREIAGIIEQHEHLILEKWNEFFRP